MVMPMQLQGFRVPTGSVYRRDAEGSASTAGDDDLIHGGGRDELLAGGPGDDLVIGGSGRDRLSGGPGDDRIVDVHGASVVLPGSGTNDNWR
jgi:Ca2+-binding RTX toxin-like protein